MTDFRIVLLTLIVLGACGQQTQKSAVSEEKPKELSFTSELITDSANLWWARDFVDVNGDGLLDIALHNDNGGGGWMGYLEASVEGVWKTVVVAELSPNGKPFATGDLEVGDMDGDGDVDLIGVEHPGEWLDGNAASTLYWYEQAGDEWIPRLVGVSPSFVKDISLADLDGDGSIEIVTATYNAETLTLFGRSAAGEYQKIWDLKIDNLHEGMDVGDLNGDGLLDIAVNGYWLPNPGSLDNAWELLVIDSQWMDQEEEHWARNATKVACRDIDRDGYTDVFITHSEKTGYPLMRYEYNGASWDQETIVDSIGASHSLVVLDIDLDGEDEIITGVNRNRAIDVAKELGLEEVPTTFPVVVLKQGADSWSSQVINSDGVYNLLAGDYEGDGDIDLIRWTSHNEPDMWLMRNSIR